MDFPPNSDKAKQKAQRAPKKVERVTTADPIRRKRPLGKKFKDVFFGDDAHTAISFAVASVVVPMIRDMIAETGQAVIQRIVYGDSKAGRRRYGAPGGQFGHVAYNRMSRDPADDRPSMGRAPSRPARARHIFDEIILSSRSDAEEVLDRMFDLVSQWEEASVADLYELVGLESKHTDHKWGWTNLDGASVERVRTGGYLLDLPEPESLS